MNTNEKLKKLLNDGETLHELYIGNEINSDIMNDISRSKYFGKTFESFFFKFVDTFQLLYDEPPIEQYDRVKLIFKFALASDNTTPSELVDNLSKFVDRGDHALFQNAFIYAIACSYKSQIMQTYMRATNSPTLTPSLTESQTREFMLTGTIDGKYLHGNKTHASSHSNKDYIAYMNTAHPLLAKYVQSKNYIQYRKILSVIGYLINPSLEKE